MFNRIRWTKKRQERKKIRAAQRFISLDFSTCRCMNCIQNVVLAALLRTCNLSVRYEHILRWNQQNAQQDKKAPQLNCLNRLGRDGSLFSNRLIRILYDKAHHFCNKLIKWRRTTENADTKYLLFVCTSM